MEDRLINLGSNRFTFRPQVGLQHKRFNWTFEATGTASIYTSNTSFFNGNRLEQDPLFILDGSIEYSIPSGIWAAAGAGLAAGGRSRVNEEEKDDLRRDLGWSLSVGFPVTRWLGLKATYLGIRNLEEAGIASDAISIGLLATW
jgi:hypothetical protein